MRPTYLLILSNIFPIYLALRYHTAKKLKVKRQLMIGKTERSRNVNLFLAILGYKTFTVYPPSDGNVYTGKTPLTVLTRQTNLQSDRRLIVHRINNTLYIA